MSHYTTVGSELVVGFFVLFTVTKILGKTQVSQITPFDFISSLILGELVGNAVYDHGTQFGEIIFTTAVWGTLVLVVEYITQKFKGTRKLLEGEPNIVIHKGMIKYQTLKKAKLDINQLQSLIRQQGVFSLQEVEYAILETNGMISVLPKNPTTTSANKESETRPTLATTLIMDGELLKGNLQEAGLTEPWLEKELANRNILTYSHVLYAEWKPDTPLFVLCYEKENSNQHHQ